MKSPQDLLQLLTNIDRQKGKGFSGIGIIVYSENVAKLPIAPLKKNVPNFIPLLFDDDLIEFLVQVSNALSEYHDGFHLLNQDFTLTHLSQYVSPPIVRGTNLNVEFGSRFTTAFYSSYLPNVISVGVLSNNYPPTVFVHGQQFD